MNTQTPNKQTPNGPRRGFTLVEVMISLLIFGIVLGVGYMFMQRTFSNMDRQKQSLDTLHEARLFLALIEKDLRQMTRLVSLDTTFKSTLFDEENARFYNMVLEIPNRAGDGITTVTYSYEGPPNYHELPNTSRVVYRQEEGRIKQALLTKQLKFLKIWGTDGAIFRNRGADENMGAYQSYLMPHYYHPTNPAANGLKDLAKVKGVEVQLCMNELFDTAGKPIKTRTFVTRIYSRVLNGKYEQ
jgi:prepilin-type N-terminal cleavage/methylation domain-containing protein